MTLRHATARAKQHRPQKPKSGGVLLAAAYFKKNAPLEVSRMSDAELLTLCTSKDCADSVLNVIGGKLENFFDIEDARRLEHYPGVGRAMALRLEVLAEVSLRILGKPAEPATMLRSEQPLPSSVDADDQDGRQDAPLGSSDDARPPAKLE
jgi:hypothetical protein